ncbi:hypothetical protein [Nitrolancea hollandica]|uniref:Uncharacterized protein n=1 Tax=Nitrolancea hollandica Lb TaxID=1129897 RepID=I4ELD9_9BACT|nr:hypothetical protein [Nitrolancea hollandica]CCF85501.1 hypothetical protein NITHO_5010004 [Nitrolancea hollandica Lb]
MQLAVIINDREFTIYVRQRKRGRRIEWEASIADWKNRRLLDRIVLGETEDLAAYLAWLELADRYGTPETYPPGVSDLQPNPTWEDQVAAGRRMDELLVWGEDDKTTDR